ncbi:ABC transporter G family member 29 [Phytophthora fragariae]|uniref:ABC transporter G family member 29 n=1 Tax=Phytophthora fragariae TaxID=53985 RepID=A0A6A3WNE1_9STRA|nr:ABC transporter G family member 29 [Phytophthora fragariae]KAE8922416.1 ABC transporter G family member 29 [Phytophthora fragariae]KAE8972615.1 ABC transporter G family member 29 [Phytophthora fragariae]KAE9070657.1 ABC transporter G family member 29 [Phytophthora fragariae]KAE9071246.1 ABC transporter G family member 29 [Phytophthora fragariae]
MNTTEPSSTSTADELSYESGKTLMAQGPQVFHDLMATKLPAATGRPLPRMEARYSNLSLSADIVVADDHATKYELPTIPNELKKTLMGPKKLTVRKEILKNMSGRLAPGKITLLLGQPGSGKSALMKVLSGRFPMAKNITMEGDISFNNVSLEQISDKLPQFVSYVEQREKLFPTITVKETLEFAHTFCGGKLLEQGKGMLDMAGQHNSDPEALEATKAIFAQYPDIVLHQLGLQICQDTIVGDNMLRGVSGGEKKRVTTGEMEFGMKYVSLMDEITTGLDAAAAYDIVDTQRSVAHRMHKTVMIALLQPSPEVFALFDDVMILNEGELMYHGPCDKVEEYFETLGFKCPPGRDVADYLLDLGTKQQHRYEVPHPTKQPRSPSEFGECFRLTQTYQEMLSILESHYDPELVASVKDIIDPVPAFHQSVFASVLALQWRALLITYRNKAFVMGKLAMVIVMGLLYCSVFYQFDPTQISVSLGIIFAAVMFLSMGQGAMIPVYISGRAIFYKQRRANFIRMGSYVLATTVSQIPLALAETIIFGSIVYWVCGFAAEAKLFIIFEIVLFVSNLAMGMWFFFLAGALPDANVVMPVGMISILVFIIFAGFVVTKSQIPDYLIWAHWISPMGWAIKALAVNQYRSSEFDVCVYDGVDYCAKYDGLNMGEYYLNLFDIATEKAWVAYGIIYLLGIYVFFMFLSYLAMEYIRYETPDNVDVTTKPIEDENSYVLTETPKAGNKSETVVELPVEAREKNFIPVTVAFQDLHYFVSNPHNPKNQLELLKGINGFAIPGSITALMGSTGAGKTTLMDVIAGRKTGGKITGKILLNGYEANDLAIRRSTGYCEQMDIHSEAATIREALTFSSFLRQDASISDSKKYDSVDECIELLGLEDIADQIIRGSSVEQMKRLTIGVELAAQPSVIFLDEPTSGLDARSAKIIMDGVCKVADSGRTIICTIHQPSAEVFYLFDRLLLLQRGGQTAFYGDLGENCRNLIDYFENIPGVAPLPEGYNPATWMLECIGAGVGHGSKDSTDFVSYFKNSPYNQQLVTTMAKEGITTPSSDLPEMVFATKRAANSKTQMKFVVSRYFQMYWRTPTYNLTRMDLAIFLGLLFGLIFVSNNDYASYSGLNSGVGMVFMSSLFNSMAVFQSVMPLTCAERESFYRERASQTYNAFWYFLAATLAEIPYCFASSLLFTAIFYWFVGFTGFWTAVVFWLGSSLLVLMMVYLAQFFVYATPSEEVAQISGILFNSIFMMFVGFSPPAYKIPSGYTWLYDICPFKFPIANLISLVFADCDELPIWNETTQLYENVGSQLGCQPMANAPETVGHITIKEYTEQYFGMKHHQIARNFGITIGIIVLFRIWAALALRYINHQKK